MAKTSIVAHFQKAKRWIEQSEYAEEAKNLQALYPNRVDAAAFFREYAHVVLASGYKWSNLDRLYPSLSKALRDFDYLEIADTPESVRRAGLSVFNHKGKIQAIVAMAVKLASNDWGIFKAKLVGPYHLEEIDALPWIGPITKYHLARNIGLDYAKPDRILCEIAAEFGYSSDTRGVFEMVEAVRQPSGERPGVIDIILWRYDEQGRPLG
ncbi:MAG: hypothetical protein FJ317_02570 [SAR202 cluster bacterium]|nr:hypothetical protein [SAR202 cluster bacterium]